MICGAMVAPSRTQANRAGDVLRHVSLSGTHDLEELRELNNALSVLAAWRSAHQYPMTKATMGLRSMVKTVGCERIEVTQRLKRAVTMIDKLRREPHMELGRMQDIGGCRAVLDSIDELRRVEGRMTLNEHFRRKVDYIAKPKDSGYRGVHVIVAYPDREDVYRFVEVQLRTLVMHDWAIAVENFSGRIGEDLKSRRGPPEVLDWLAHVSEAMAIEEQGGVVPQALLDRVDAGRESARPFLEGGRRRA